MVSIVLLSTAGVGDLGELGRDLICGSGDVGIANVAADGDAAVDVVV